LEAMGIEVDENEFNELYRLVYQTLKIWIDEDALGLDVD
jgi:hypothetical protein